MRERERERAHQSIKSILQSSAALSTSLLDSFDNYKLAYVDDVTWEGSGAGSAMSWLVVAGSRSPERATARQRCVLRRRC